jgi:hypothetical protein
MNEEEYRRCLDCERRLYAWCLVSWGGCTTEQAERNAQEFYVYEPPEQKHRELVFHDSAWGWAMFHIHGDGYWSKRPELQRPPAEFNREYDRVYGSHQDAN